MERGWQVIAPIDGAQKYARIQRHAAGQQGRGGGQKDSRKRQSSDGFEKTADNAGSAILEFRSRLLYELLVRAQADDKKVGEAIESMNFDRQISVR